MSEHSIETKLGTTRAGPRTRVWLQGSRLADHGFPVGSKFRKQWTDNRLVITSTTHEAFDELPRNERGTVSGDVARPVIDVTGQIVAETFKHETVVARFTSGRIVISNQ